MTDCKEHSGFIQSILDRPCFLIDMDGVIYHGERLLPGVKEFLSWLEARNKQYLFLTNGSRRTTAQLKERFARLGIFVQEDRFHTSAISTAMFLGEQKPHGSAFVIADDGVIEALQSVGYHIIEEGQPDYVIVGETFRNYNLERIAQAINYVHNGAKLIGTNCDTVDNAADGGLAPACGSLIAPIEKATNTLAYFVGKPNPLMFRTALKKLGSHSGECVMVGDRMETDVMGGMEAGMATILVLSGVTKKEDLQKFAFVPSVVLGSVADIPKLSSRQETKNQVKL